MPRSAAAKKAGAKYGLRLLVGAGAGPASGEARRRRRRRLGRLDRLPERAREEPHIRLQRQEPGPRTRIEELAEVALPDPGELPVRHLRDLVDAPALDGDRQAQRDQPGDARVAAAGHEPGDGAAAQPADDEALDRIVTLHPVERVAGVVDVTAERDRSVEVGQVRFVDLALGIAQAVEVEAEHPVALGHQRCGQLVVEPVRRDPRLDAGREQDDGGVAAAIGRRVHDADEALAAAVGEGDGLPIAHAAASSHASVASNSRGALA